MIYSSDYNKFKARYIETAADVIFSSLFLAQVREFVYEISDISALSQFPQSSYDQYLAINRCIKLLHIKYKSSPENSLFIDKLIKEDNLHKTQSEEITWRKTNPKIESCLNQLFSSELDEINSRIINLKQSFKESERVRNRWKVFFLFDSPDSIVTTEYKNSFLSNDEEFWEKLLTNAPIGKTKVVFTKNEFEKLWNFCQELKKINDSKNITNNHFLFFKTCTVSQHRQLKGIFKKYDYIFCLEKAIKLIQEYNIAFKSRRSNGLFFYTIDDAVKWFSETNKNMPKGSRDIKDIVSRIVILGEIKDRKLLEKRLKSV